MEKKAEMNVENSSDEDNAKLRIILNTRTAFFPTIFLLAFVFNSEKILVFFCTLHFFLHFPAAFTCFFLYFFSLRERSGRLLT